MQEGRALLCGDEGSVYKQFQEDKRQVKFSKEHAVKIVIQLVSNRYRGIVIYKEVVPARDGRLLETWLALTFG